MSLKKARLLFFVFLFLLSGALSFVPGHNGDMPYYIATVFAKTGITEAEALSDAKTVIVSEMTFEESQTHIYRLDHAEKNILDYYRIKPFYIICVDLLHRCGFSFINATLIPSVISFFFIGYFLFAWSSRVFKPLPAVVFSMILMLMNPAIILARLSSPDSISNLFLFICFYRIYFQKSYVWTTLLLLTCLFVRLDNFISVFVLLSLMACWPDKKTPVYMPIPFYISCMLLAVGLCLWINFHFENNFWWFLKINYLQSLRAYGLQVLIYCLSVSKSFLPALIILGFLAYFFHKEEIDKKRVAMIMGIACIFLFRFLLFPSFEERFNTAYYLCGFLLLSELFAREKHPGNLPIFNSPAEYYFNPEAFRRKRS
jgi:hypothetical protein